MSMKKKVEICYSRDGWMYGLDKNGNRTYQSFSEDKHGEVVSHILPDGSNLGALLAEAWAVNGTDRVILEFNNKEENV